MWHMYSLIAVLFGGAYCTPITNTVKQPQCQIAIKRFGETIKSLEVQWDSTIHLTCDASCVGAGPQPALTWFYKNKITNNSINIERLFRSSKFDTYPTYYRRRNELRIRNFGVNEETTFICKGSARGEKLKEKITLYGTDCLLKYNFRCSSGNRCIDRGYLCNDNNECPDGEDEIGCGIDTDTNKTVSTMREPGTEFKTNQTSIDIDYVDGTETDGKSIQTSDAVTTKTDEQSTQTSGEVDYTVTTETDEKPTQDLDKGQPCEFKCSNGTCIAPTNVCNGFPDCPNGEDEITCDIGPTCLEGKKTCNDRSKCIEGSQFCDGVPDCSDGSDEENCRFDIGPTCLEGKKTCNDRSTCIEGSQFCDGVPDCPDGSDEENCRFGIIMSQKGETGIIVDGQTVLVSNIDGVTASSAGSTTPFDYYVYME